MGDKLDFNGANRPELSLDSGRSQMESTFVQAHSEKRSRCEKQNSASVWQPIRFVVTATVKSYLFSNRGRF